MCFSVRLIEAPAGQIGQEGCFIDSLVYAGSTFDTAKVASGGFKLVLRGLWWVLSLGLQKVLNDLCSGLFLWQRLVRVLFIQGQLLTFLFES